MTLIKTSLFNAIAVAIKMLTMLGINKILAIYVGPTGYVALGHFQNAVQMIVTFSSGAISTGVTKYTAEYHGDEAQQRKIWKTAGTISLIGSVFIGFFLVVFSDLLSVFLFGVNIYRSVLIWFGLTLIFFIFNSLLLAILNGKKEIGKYVASNISGSILIFLFTAFLVYQYKLYGALIAVAVYQSLGFFSTLYLCRKSKWFKIDYLFGEIDKKVAFNLFKYSLMIMTTAVCAPISQMMIREYLAEFLGSNFAGYWEAMSRLSSAYLMLITSTLSVYFLPKISELSSGHEIRNEIIKGYKVIIPFVSVSCLIIYFFRDVIIKILFSEDFLPMQNLFAWQVIGDILKIGAWMMSYIMLSKAMMRTYISTEIIFSITFVILVFLLTPIWGFEGSAIAYMINYGLYWAVMFKFVYKKII